MASADVLPLPTHQSNLDPTFNHVETIAINSSKRKRPEDLVSSGIPEMGNENPPKLDFDATKHLNYHPPTRIWSMKEIGKEGQGISPNAVSEPFQLFTEEAIKQMRAEVLSKGVLDNCKYSSNLAHCQLRGFAPEFAPFVLDAWRNPVVLDIVSKIAGVELVPQMDFEIGHINISTEDNDDEDVVKAVQEKAHRDADEGVSGCPWEDDHPIVDWHTDSYPFVCVTMLSDCTNMIGGETALRKGDGEVMKVRGPGMGNAVVLQGRYIEHQAMRALGSKERITMVTSFRPKSAFAKDDTVLTTVRPISNLTELYSQYTEYRFEMLEERLRAQLKEIRDRKRARRGFNTAGVKAFIVEQKSFLEVMLRELVDDDKVIQGYTEDSHLLSDDLKMQSKKKARFALEGAGM